MRTYQVSQLTTRIRQAADIENDQHVTDTEILSLLNVYYPWFWDILVECAPPDYFSTTVDFVTVPNQLSYALNTVAPAGDFYKLRHIYVMETTGLYRCLEVVPESQLQSWVPCQSGSTVHMLYVPSCPFLVLTTDTVDGYNGWEELLVQRCAAAIKKKREEDYGPYMQAVAELEKRIRSLSNRDLDEPERIVRRRFRQYTRWYYNNVNVDGYRIRAGNIEIYTRAAWFGYFP